jgi:hypothetical protein
VAHQSTPQSRTQCNAAAAVCSYNPARPLFGATTEEGGVMVRVIEEF